ncbi:TRAP transporter substrate-binding protein [Chloroflexota bacterium]
MKKLMVILVPLLVLSLVLGAVGCGGDEATPVPTVAPTAAPTVAPTGAPTAAPTGAPTAAPTGAPTGAPTAAPTPTPKHETIVLKLAHGKPPGEFVDLVAEKFKELAAEYTDGVVQIEVFPLGTLVSDYIQFDAISTGIADLGLCSGYLIQSVIPDWKIFFHWFWWDGAEHAKAFLDHPDGGQQMIKKLEQFNIKGLLTFPESALNIWVMKDKEVKSAWDAAGLRFRSVWGLAGVPQVLIGASTLQIAYAEALAAYEQGVVNAYGDTTTAIVASKLYEMSKYAFIMPWGIMADRNLIMNLDKWNNLPADIRDMISNTIIPELNNWAYENRDRIENEAAGILEEHITVHYQTKAEREELRDAIWPLVEPYMENVDPDLLALGESLR